ncbi:hypothetical protein [Vibrio coralliilyticus]
MAAVKSAMVHPTLMVRDAHIVEY